MALLRTELVERRRWLDDPAFLDLVGAANLIPGPTSTELVMHIGYRRAGWAGLVVAGLSFILPSVAIVAALAWAYVEGGTRPAVELVLVGVGPVVIAIIARAAWSIGRTALRTLVGLGIAIAAVIGALAGVPEIALLLGLGFISLVLAAGAVGLARMRDQAGAFALTLLPGSASGESGPGAPLVVVAAIGPAVATAPAIFLEFLRIGAVLFGSGYLLVALLQAELVERLGWITGRELIDAVAVGQATPGPLFSTATFIGYLLDGPVGATAATVGIFLPAFAAVAISIPLLARLRGSATFRAFLDGVNAAAVGLLAVAAYRLGIDVLDDVLAVVVALTSFVLLARGIGPVWLIVAGAAIAVVRAIVVA